MRAKFPHAKILNIDTSKAKTLPGVYAVLTHADVPGSKNHGLIYNDWPVLCQPGVAPESSLAISSAFVVMKKCANDGL